MAVDGVLETSNGTITTDKPLLVEQLLSDVEKLDCDSVKEVIVKCCCSCGGLLENRFREKLWPFVVTSQTDKNLLKSDYQTPSKEELKLHKDHYQVYIDVSRSLKRFPPSIQCEDSVVDKYMDDLIEVILKILDTDSSLHYYQGFHDVLVTFLMVLGKEVTFKVAEKLVQSHLKLFMAKTMQETNDMLYLMYAIFEKEDKSLFSFLMRAELGVIFALPWLITWFSHNLNDLNLVLRLFDLFIVSHPYLPVYLSAAIVLHMRDEILSSECEMPVIHKMLGNQINSKEMPWNKLISQSLKLINKYPPTSLENRAQFIQKISAPKPRNERRVSEQKGVLSQWKNRRSVITFMYSWVKTRPVAMTALMFSAVLFAYMYNSYYK